MFSRESTADSDRVDADSQAGSDFRSTKSPFSRESSSFYDARPSRELSDASGYDHEHGSMEPQNSDDFTEDGGYNGGYVDQEDFDPEPRLFGFQRIGYGNTVAVNEGSYLLFLIHGFTWRTDREQDTTKGQCMQLIKENNSNLQRSVRFYHVRISLC